MKDPKHYTTAPEDRIPIVSKTAYALGMLANNVQAAAVGAMAVILNLGLGLNPALVGIIGFVPRIFDAISDPMMGYISDNTRSRYGRRRPYIFWGAIAAGIIFALMWQLPRGHSEMWYFWVFMSASIIFFLAYTVFATPFVALGYELTPDYHERTRLMGFSNIFGQFAWLIAPWFYKFVENDRFDGPVEGAKVLAIIIGAFIICVGILPALFTKERYNAPPKDSVGFTTNLKKFFKGFAVTFKCKPFIKLCAATFLVFNGYMLGAAFTLYVMIYYIFAGNTDKGGTLMGAFGTVSSICTFLVILLTTWMSTKLGKRKTFIITISVSVVGFAMKWFCYSTTYPYALLICAPFIAFGIGSLFTLMGAMVADVCDLGELETGERRVGMFGSIYWWMVKLGMAVASLVAGILLNVTGFDVALGAAQSAKTLFLMRVFDVGVPLVTSVIAILCLLSFGLTEERAHEIRAELEKRRGKAA